MQTTKSLTWLLDQFEQLGKFRTDRNVFINPLLFYTSILVNMNGGHTLNSNDKKIKYFGITLAGSGVGKNFTFDEIERAFDINNVAYSTTMRNHISMNYEFDEGLKYTIDNGFKSDKLNGLENALLFTPDKVVTSIEGTVEGLLNKAFPVSAAQFASLNLMHSELGDVLSGSFESIQKLKELFDENVAAKVIKSSKTPDINNITTNVLLLGSPAGVDRETKKLMLRALKSGLYRRSIIYEIKLTDIERQPNYSIESQNQLRDEISTYIKQVTQLVSDRTNTFTEELTFTYEPLFHNKLVEIQDELIDEANANKENDWKQIDVSAVSIIENIAHLLAVLDLTTHIQSEYLDVAYYIFNQSRLTIKGIIEPPSLHIDIFNILNLSRKKMSLHELNNYVEIPIAARSRTELIELFREYSYHKGLVPHISGESVKYLKLTEPEPNTLDKIIVSIDCHDYELKKCEPQQSVSYAQLELPFFGESQSIQYLVRHNSIKSFTTAWFEPSAQANKYSSIDGAGHRKADNFIQGQNLIAFDIDDGLTIDEAEQLLASYTYLIYTTRSHRTEKNGELQGDRFRILIPTRTTFYTDSEKHKKLVENVADFLGIRIFDKATRNTSRLWYINPDAEIILHETDNLLDVSSLIPETEKANLMLPLLNSLNQLDTEELDEYERRKLGFQKYVLTQYGPGNRNDLMFKYAKFIDELGGPVEHEVISLNAMTSDPLPDRELNSIIKRFDS